MPHAYSSNDTMPAKSRRAMAIFVLSAFTLCGCAWAASGQKTQTPQPTRLDGQAAAQATAIMNPAKAAATQPSMGAVHGTVNFKQVGNDVEITADLTGVPPGKHGFHIHDKGDLSAPDLSSAGGHYNPGHEHHGGPAAEHHHAGDLGNVTADEKGDVHYTTTVKNLQLKDIIGRSVILHAKADDLKSDPAGNSGARIAGGKIETATAVEK